MIIGIDASRALRRKRTGTEVHNAEIIKHLTKLDAKNEYWLYSSEPPHGDLQDLPGKVTWKVLPFTRGWTLIRLSLEMAFRPPQVLFVPAHILPIITPRRSVVMLHDIGFDHFPELYKTTDIVYHRYAVQFAKLFASHILTPSEFTRQDLHEKYGIPLAKMTTVHHGFDPTGFRPAKKDEASPRDVPYFYYVGRLEHKKNIVRMLEAFHDFKQSTNLPHKFLLAGRKAHGWDEIQKTYESLGNTKDSIEFLDYIPTEESQRYLRHADGFMFTTLFEGFGMPVLEAFASGTPVITSNTTSLPEVVGDAAITVSPTSVSAITEAMKNLAESAELRQALTKKGFERMSNFSWDKAAQETLAILEKVGHA